MSPSVCRPIHTFLTHSHTHQSTCETSPWQRATGQLPLLGCAAGRSRSVLSTPSSAVLRASGRKHPKCPSARHAYIFPKGLPGNFPLQEILPLPCPPTPASPHRPSQVTITACLQHMTAVTFLACFTPPSCHPAVKHMKTQEPKGLGMLRVSTSPADSLEQGTPSCQRFPSLSREI